MLDKFRTKKKKASDIGDGKRIYAIGDIHGCAAELDTLLDKIAADGDSADLASSVFSDGADGHAPKPQQLIFLGDYVDRGPDSKGVIDRLITLKNARPESIFLKGNHEAIMMDFLNDPEDMLHWLEWGGEETLASYGVTCAVSRPAEELAAELTEKMPSSHLPFLKSLSLTHQKGDYLFVHAGVRPGVAIADQQEEDLLWIRGRFHKASANERPDCVVVHGHQPMKKPLDAGWRIAVDTGACWTGQLTAVALEGVTRRFIST